MGCRRYSSPLSAPAPPPNFSQRREGRRFLRNGWPRRFSSYTHAWEARTQKEMEAAAALRPASPRREEEQHARGPLLGLMGPSAR